MRDNPEPMWTPRQSLGRYRILGFLGVGGMAEVYQARHETLMRDIALKGCLPNASRTSRGCAFVQEARAGKAGQAILFVAPRERRMLSAIEPMRHPTREDIAGKRIAAFKRSVVSGYRDEHDGDLLKVAAALVYLTQKDKPFRPGPPAVEETPGRAPAGPQAPDAPPRKQPLPPRGRPRASGRGAPDRRHDRQRKHIGAVRIFETFSTVELPPGMPREIFRHVQKVRVRGRKLFLKPVEGK